MSHKSAPRVVKVALPLPLPQLFDYLPAADGPAPRRGVRVEVPLGRRRLLGIVVETATQSVMDPARLLRISHVLDAGLPLLDQPLLDLLQWCWGYYKHAPGEVLQAALPPLLRKVGGQLPEPPQCISLTPAGELRLQHAPANATAQSAMLQRLRDGPQAESALAVAGTRWRATLARLKEHGWVRSAAVTAPQARVSPGPPLTAEQGLAVDRVGLDLQAFHCHLLDGVTGGGKTEVYLQVLERVLALGRQGLVLVPEIGLTPQLLRRFSHRLGFDPTVMHSGLGQRERMEAWDAVRTGRSRLLIGTRSALFTPMPELGLIILDEEHDASFKQQEGFRYSARDVAVKRAAQLGIPVLLGSATPSLESLYNAATGRYQHHRIRQRATQAALPDWRVLDMAQQSSLHGLAAGSITAISAALDRGEQAMVFLNRRGYAPVLMCTACGWHGQCERCDARLTWHRSVNRLCCHHCGSQKKAPALCPHCRADALSGLGEGTQQLEDALRGHFPGVPVLRFDRDSTHAPHRFDQQVEQVLQGEACILVGTQMLAKGHHFPMISLVVVANVDQALYSADFRALERLGQTLVQVSGRAGRAGKVGTVVLQTFHPDSEALALLIQQGYESYANWLLQDRHRTRLPPVTFQALLRANAHRKEEVEGFLRHAVKVFPPGESQLFGPLPAIMERVAGRYRMYVLIQAHSRPALHRQIDAWLEPLRRLPAGRKVRWAIDVDPQEL